MEKIHLPSPKIGDKIEVRTHFGNKICVIDKVDEKTIHFKNGSFGLEVNSERVQPQSKEWRGSKFYYSSFN